MHNIDLFWMYKDTILKKALIALSLYSDQHRSSINSRLCEVHTVKYILWYSQTDARLVQLVTPSQDCVVAAPAIPTESSQYWNVARPK